MLTSDTKVLLISGVDVPGNLKCYKIAKSCVLLHTELVSYHLFSLFNMNSLHFIMFYYIYNFVYTLRLTKKS